MRDAGVGECREDIGLFDVQIVMAPVLVPVRPAAPAIVERENAPAVGCAVRDALEVVGGARQAGQADQRQSPSPRRGIVEIMQPQAVGGGRSG